MILDPGDVVFNAITGGISSSETRLGQEIMRFGHVINKKRLFPGDLILSVPLRGGGKFSALTRNVQEARFRNHFDWTHAMVYYHDWIVIEATPEDNVSDGSILNIMLDHRIMVRRGKYLIEQIKAGKVDFARTIGLTIALEASLLQTTAKYGKLSALSIYIRDKLRAGFPRPDETRKKSIICSGLYARSYRIATGRGLLSAAQERAEESITPALLANSDELETVNVGWAMLS